MSGERASLGIVSVYAYSALECKLWIAGIGSGRVLGLKTPRSMKTMWDEENAEGF